VQGLKAAVKDFFIEGCGEEVGVFGFTTHGAKQGTGGRPIIGGLASAEGGITFRTYAGVPDGDGAWIVFVVVHMIGVFSPARFP